MYKTSLWRELLGVDKNTMIEQVEYDEDADIVVAQVRVSGKLKPRCGQCGKRCSRYDQGEGPRRWRGLDLGTIQVWLQAQASRVRCPAHGVVVVQLPWARHAAGHTHAFDAQVAWLATKSSKTTVTELMRVAWRTVGTIVARVWADAEQLTDRFEGLTRIGVDEISYKKGHKYLMVVDHDTKTLVWAAPGRTKDTLRKFFDLLGPQRCRLITHVSADGADFIGTVAAEKCPNAVRVADPFHVVQWTTEALNDVRRESWNDARKLARADPPVLRASQRPQRGPICVTEKPGRPHPKPDP